MKKNISILIMAIMPLFSVLAQQPDIAKVNKILGFMYLLIVNLFVNIRF